MRIHTFLFLLSCPVLLSAQTPKSLIESSPLSQNQLSYCTYYGDVDGDGADELVTFNSGTLTVQRQSDRYTLVLSHTLNSNTISRLIIGDFVNEGRERGKKQIGLVLSDGTTQFFAISDDRRSLWWWFTQPTFIDYDEYYYAANFDADVADELMVHNPRTGRIRFLKRVNGFFAESPNFDRGYLPSSGSTNLTNVKIRVGEFSPDSPGRKDLLVVSSVRRMRLYRSQVEGERFTFQQAFTFSGNLLDPSASIHVANIDGGAKDGIIAYDRIRGTYSFWNPVAAKRRIPLTSNQLTLAPINNVTAGQLPAQAGGSLVAVKVRDLAFRTEQGGEKRDDIIFLINNREQLIRSDARFDGTQLTYWWAHNRTLRCN